MKPFTPLNTISRYGLVVTMVLTCSGFFGGSIEKKLISPDSDERSKAIEKLKAMSAEKREEAVGLVFKQLCTEDRGIVDEATIARGADSLFQAMGVQPLVKCNSYVFPVYCKKLTPVLGKALREDAAPQLANIAEELRTIKTRFLDGGETRVYLDALTAFALLEAMGPKALPALPQLVSLLSLDSSQQANHEIRRAQERIIEVLAAIGPPAKGTIPDVMAYYRRSGHGDLAGRKFFLAMEDDGVGALANVAQQESWACEIAKKYLGGPAPIKVASDCETGQEKIGRNEERVEKERLQFHKDYSFAKTLCHYRDKATGDVVNKWQCTAPAGSTKDCSCPPGYQQRHLRSSRSILLANCSEERTFVCEK